MRKRKTETNKNRIFGFVLKLEIFLIIFCFVFYLNQLNTMIKENYLIKDYKVEIKKQYEDNKKLEKKWYNFSLNEIEKMAKKMDFEKIDKITYIKIAPSWVAGR